TPCSARPTDARRAHSGGSGRRAPRHSRDRSGRGSRRGRSTARIRRAGSWTAEGRPPRRAMVRVYLGGATAAALVADRRLGEWKRGESNRAGREHAVAIVRVPTDARALRLRWLRSMVRTHGRTRDAPRRRRRADARRRPQCVDHEQRRRGRGCRRVPRTPRTGSPERVRQERSVTESQVSALASSGTSAVFLVLTVSPGEDAAARVREVCANVPAFVRSVGRRHPGGGLSCVVAIGAHAWDRLAPGKPRPAQLHAFRALTDGPRTAPATPGDLLFHIRANRRDFCHELSRIVIDKLGDAVQVVDETHGFVYMDNRDLIGFVDGTENPEGDA